MDLWLIIVIVVAAIIVIGFVAWLFLRGDSKSMQPLEGAPVDGPVARAIAVGALQLDNDEFPWNDITGSALDQKQQRKLREMWGLTDRDAWLENIESLTSGNRFDGPIVAMMAIRAEIAPEHRQPTDKEWLAAIKSHGGTGKGEEKTFVSNVRRWEKNLRKVGKNFIVYPADYAATSLEGYNIGQAAAMVVWGNSMGFAEPGEAEKLLAEISAIAKRQFGSWEEFGRSYLLGRCVNLYRLTGKDNDKVQSSVIGTMWSYHYAFKGEHGGPWATLAW